MTPQDLLDDVKSQVPAHLHDYLSVNQFGVLLHHPFRIVPSLNALPPEFGVESVASWIEANEAEYIRFCEAGEWEGALSIVERPYRAEYLVDLIAKHGVEKLICAVNYVWADAENVSNDEEAFDLWWGIWSQVSCTRQGKDRRRRFHVMEPAEREAFFAMPDRMTVYRGYSIAGSEHGYSWTLDRNMAEWFARRFARSQEGKGAFVATMEVTKDEILAYFTGRKEAEVVVRIWGVSADRMQIETLPDVIVDAA